MWSVPPLRGPRRYGERPDSCGSDDLIWRLRLIARPHHGAAEALRLDAERCRLVESHVRLAEKLARTNCLWGSEDLDDTRSDALWGLVHAARAFEPGRAGFAPYATVSIKGAIRRGRQLRSGVPRAVWERGDRSGAASLNVPVGEGGEELLDFLPSAHDDEAGLLEEVIRQLPARECLVLRLRYFHGLAQREVGEIIGCGQMQVSRIERAALAKLHDFASDAVTGGPSVS
jgi:RNA polymerase sigma factor (sigma-70 family)